MGESMFVKLFLKSSPVEEDTKITKRTKDTKTEKKKLKQEMNPIISPFFSLLLLRALLLPFVCFVSSSRVKAQ